MAKSIWKGLTLITLVCAACAAVADGIKWAPTYRTALTHAKSGGKIVMIDFYTDWCVWCKRLDQTSYLDPSVVKESQRFSPVKVNAEKEGRALAARYSVHSYPTIVFLDSHEKVVQVVEGYLRAPDLAKKMKKAYVLKAEAPAYAARLAKNPKDYEAAGGMALVCMARLQVAQAVKYMNAAEKIDPKGHSDLLSEAYRALGDQAGMNHSLNDAVTCYQHADMKAKSPETKLLAKTSIAIAFMTGRRPDLAVPPLENGLKLRGATPETRKLAGQLLAEAHRMAGK